MNIYELTGQWNELYEMADDPDMDADVWFDTMEGLEGEIEDKADGYAKVIKQLEADALSIKAEKDRLASKQASLENKAKYLKQRLQDAMESVGKDKIKTSLFSFGIQNNPPSVFIPDESIVPDEFLVPQPPKIDKKAIASLLKDGIEVEWAELQQGKSLRIR